MTTMTTINRRSKDDRSDDVKWEGDRRKDQRRESSRLGKQGGEGRVEGQFLHLDMNGCDRYMLKIHV